MTTTTNCEVCDHLVSVKFCYFSKSNSYSCPKCGTIEIVGDSLRIGDYATPQQRKRFMLKNYRGKIDPTLERTCLQQISNFLFS